MTKNTQSCKAHFHPTHRKREERPITSRIRAQRNGEQGQIPTKPSHLRRTPTQAHFRRSKKTPWWSWTQGGPIGVPAALMLVWLEPNLARLVHTASPKAVHKVSGRFNIPTRQFALAMRGWSIIQRAPSSPPIKGGSPFLIWITHKTRAQEQEKSITTPWA